MTACCYRYISTVSTGKGRCEDDSPCKALSRRGALPASRAGGQHPDALCQMAGPPTPSARAGHCAPLLGQVRRNTTLCSMRNRSCFCTLRNERVHRLPDALPPEPTGTT
jgi:hypothetical protein